MNSVVRGIGPLIIAFYLSTGYALAQQSTLHPPPDAQDLYAAFFYFHDDLSRWTENQSAKKPASAMKLKQGAAKYLHVDITELDKVSIVTHTVAAQLKGLGQEISTYLNQRASINRVPTRPKYSNLRPDEYNHRVGYQSTTTGLVTNRLGWVAQLHQWRVQAKYQPVCSSGIVTARDSPPLSPIDL